MNPEEVAKHEELQAIAKLAPAGVFGYAAGKSIIARKLVTHFPKHGVYTEPFCGSAAMFFTKEAAPVEVLNDIDKEVAFAHRAIKSLTKSEFADLAKRDWFGKKETFKSVFKSEPSSKVDRLYKFLYLVNFSYAKGRRTFSPGRAGATSTMMKRIEKFQPRYKNTKILCGDYGTVLKSYDGKEAFHFLDPPYAGTSAPGIGVGEKGFDEVAFRKQLEGLKGNFLVTYGTKGNLDTSGFEVKRMRQERKVQHMRAAGGGSIGGDKFMTHLLISNFKVQAKSLGAGVELDDVMQMIDTDDRGSKIMVMGSRTSVSVPDQLVSRAWKNDEPLLAYPEHAGPIEARASLRFLDKSVEMDLGFGEIAWTLDVQRSPAVGDPAEVAKTFSIEGSRFFRPLTKGVPAFLTPAQSVASTVVKREEGMLVEYGLQTPTSHEYFFSKSDGLSGQLTIEKAPEENLGAKYPYLATFIDTKFIPNAVLKGSPMPPEGVSALPQSLERIVPAEFRYWEAKGEQAVKMRDALASSGFFGAGSVAIVDGELGRVLTKHVLYEPEPPTPTSVDWPLVKAASLLPDGAALEEVFSPGALKNEPMLKSVVYVDACDAGAGPIEMLAKSLLEGERHYVVTSLDIDGARAALGKLGRVFKFIPGDGVGVDAVDRLFVTSLGVRGDDIEWLDKAEAAAAIYNEPSDDSPDLGKLEKKIEHKKDGWHVFSEDGSKHLGGPYGSKEEAVARLRQVEGHAQKDGDFVLAPGDAGALQPVVGYDQGNPKVRRKKGEEHFTILKADDEQYVLGIVLEPDTVDAQQDIYSADEVRQAAHKYMDQFQNTGLMHKEIVNGKVSVLESYLAPVDFNVGGQSVKKGTWIMAVRVKDKKIWNDVKTGGLTGFSIGGSANRTPDPAAHKKYVERKSSAMKTIDFQGLPLTIDRPKGHVQTGKAPDGTEWTREYKVDYGFIPRTKGGDGEGLDVFVGPNAKSHKAFWVMQKTSAGEFDEYKLIVGADDQEQAKKIYLDHVPEKFFAGMYEGSVHQIKALLNQEPSEPLTKMIDDLVLG